MNFISHLKNDVDLQEIVRKKREKIIQLGDSEDATVEERLDLLQQLTEFEFGRFLLKNKGLNGYWTRYLNLYPKYKTFTKPITHPLEKFLVEKCPETLSTQQRFDIFQTLLQDSLKNGVKMCSLPCGLMDDLLTLNFNNVSYFKLVGIDIDVKSIEQARNKAIELKLEDKTEFLVADVWQLKIENEYDVVASHGLNCYVSDLDRLIQLYQVFYRILKPGGKLIISSVLPLSTLKTSDSRHFNENDAKKSRVLLYQVVECNWANFRTDSETIEQLKQVGFNTIEMKRCHIEYARVFVATKK